MDFYSQNYTTSLFQFKIQLFTEYALMVIYTCIASTKNYPSHPELVSGSHPYGDAETSSA